MKGRRVWTWEVRVTELVRFSTFSCPICTLATDVCSFAPPFPRVPDLVYPGVLSLAPQNCPNAPLEVGFARRMAIQSHDGVCHVCPPEMCRWKIFFSTVTMEHLGCL